MKLGTPSLQTILIAAFLTAALSPVPAAQAAAPAAQVAMLAPQAAHAAAPATDDIVPPSRPTGLRDNCVSDYPGVVFCWQPSTDNVAVTAYDVYRETSTGYVKVGTAAASAYPIFSEPGLVPGQRYTYVVVARDAAGNISQPSEPVSALAREGLPVPTRTPTPQPGLSCAATYLATSWNTGLTAGITVKNTGTTAIDGWTLTVDYPTSDVRLSGGWSAGWTQAGSRLSGVNESWNKVIGTGATTQVGFNAWHSGYAPAPTKIALNGTTCTVL
ncbi:cellulose binding domain-containing protein [Sphaerisporangium sp. NPDC049002]|uniref:cellulose binding domain-containing protein n=1 Tax=unclassified Sphaerisporangium TaxID=2630420 RepID=UPI0033CB777C